MSRQWAGRALCHKTFSSARRLTETVIRRRQHHAAGVADLVVRAKSGDRTAFDHLVLRYRERIYALALHITSDESEADDVTQDVFLKAFRSLSDFRGGSQFFTWLYRIAINRALTARRVGTRRSLRMVSDPRLERAVAVDAAGDPCAAAELRRRYARLLWALDQLPVALRMTVILVCLQGLSHAEAASILGCPTGTVAWRIHSSRQRLQHLLHHAVAPQTAELAERLRGLLNWSAVSGASELPQQPN